VILIVSILASVMGVYGYMDIYSIYLFGDKLVVLFFFRHDINVILFIPVKI
jgi:hypothetical protein